MKKHPVFIIFSVLILCAGSVFLFLGDVARYLPSLSFLNPVGKTLEATQRSVMQGTEKQVSLPPPLRAAAESSEAFLTRSGVIWQTNDQRVNAGLQPLKENKQLDAAAEIKLKDMFNQQYFAHVSPKGVGVDGLAQTTGYEYIAIGENLALGNFENDKILVQAWMDSEGHRKNLLSVSFTEIGVAIGQGIYEGRKTWLAVQEFGRPLSDCPQPSGALKAQIDGNELRLDQLSREVDVSFYALQSMRPKHGVEYNQKVDEYNALVEQYNNLLDANKELVSRYNEQVTAFNVCAAQ